METGGYYVSSSHAHTQHACTNRAFNAHLVGRFSAVTAALNHFPKLAEVVFLSDGWILNWER